MTQHEFESLKKQFINADVDTKIVLYTNSDDLTSDQYKDLLRNYPIEELPKLEDALNALE
ncbi:MAG: hypothetical protein LBL35_03735 [Clostridiales bacterium]|nr:hypothetical protein [Clostridiales bacterium]